MAEFAENLRERLAELDLTYAEAARRCGLSERRFANYCSGDREPNLTLLAKIAKTLDTSTDALLGMGGEESTQTPDKKELLLSQLTADLKPMDASLVALAAALVRTLIGHHRKSVSRKK